MKLRTRGGQRCVGPCSEIAGPLVDEDARLARFFALGSRVERPASVGPTLAKEAPLRARGSDFPSSGVRATRGPRASTRAMAGRERCKSDGSLCGVQSWQAVCNVLRLR